MDGWKVDTAALKATLAAASGDAEQLGRWLAGDRLADITEDLRTSDGSGAPVNGVTGEVLGAVQTLLDDQGADLGVIITSIETAINGTRGAAGTILGGAATMATGAGSATSEASRVPAPIRGRNAT